jgi:hypothetical protein
MEYIEVYSFRLFDRIMSGNKIYCLDRKLKKVFTVNELTADRLVALIKSAEEELNRYEFWYEEAEESDVAKATEVTKETEEDEDD